MADNGKRWAQVGGLSAIVGVALSAAVLAGSAVRAAAETQTRLETHLQDEREWQASPRLARIEARLDDMCARLARIETILDRSCKE